MATPPWIRLRVNQGKFPDWKQKPIGTICSVDRFVKYTGYGNAAGLLASRGLLAGGSGGAVYSDTDTDSDTEEYKAVCDKLVFASLASRCIICLCKINHV